MEQSNQARPYERFWPDEDAGENLQAEASKDYDRILYSTAFRRLGGVTQVVGANETALFHNRLTHTLKTAQVGARIADHIIKQHNNIGGNVPHVQDYGGLVPHVVRAACLAHDLGHPPFGHNAEEELRILTSDSPDDNQHRRPSALSMRHPRVGTAYKLDDSFEGNAQTFRTVTKLAFREKTDDPNMCPALNLTRATLRALMKYPWGFRRRPKGIEQPPISMKFGYYDSEHQIANWLFGQAHYPNGLRVDLPSRRYEYRTLEAQVMDWADDISYAVHDVEDFFRAGAIPLDTLKLSDQEWDSFLSYAWNKTGGVADKIAVPKWDYVKDSVESVRKLFPSSPYSGSRSDREFLHTFASTLIKEATKGTCLSEPGVITVDDQQLGVIETLKELTWYFVLDRPGLHSAHRGQRYLIRSLFRDLISWVDDVWVNPYDSRADSRGAGRAERRKLPTRLNDYLAIAFSPDNVTGSDTYTDNQKIARSVIDYIVSLTEIQALELHARITGKTIGSILDSYTIYI